MLALGIDTSSPAVSVALIDGDLPPPPPGMKPGETRGTFGPGPSTIAARTEVAANRHGELLASLVAEVIKEAGVSASDLAAVGVGLGPGPFTGLRVGIMTARAMGDALDIPTYGIGSLDVIARDLSGSSWGDEDDMEHDFAVVTDARRKQVYWATYGFTGSRIDGPEISPPVELTERWGGDIRYVGGAGALLYGEVFGGFTIFERSPYPSAAMIAEFAWGQRLTRKPSGDLKPLYLRRPDAKPPGAPKKVTPV